MPLCPGEEKPLLWSGLLKEEAGQLGSAAIFID
jgi:hypothetical protein